MKTVFKPMKPMWMMGEQMRSQPPSKLTDIGGRRKASLKTPIETEKNDGPGCSIEQTRNYQENWDKILPPKVIKQLKRTGDTMHGSYSVNLQMPEEFHRQAHDIDVWSKKPSTRATEMENAIDKCVGCDIAHIKEQAIGKAAPKIQTLGPPRLREKGDDKVQFTRYTVVTEPKNDVDVDYGSYPTDRPLKTRSLSGIKHEALDSALERAYGLQYRPMRAGRAREDIRRIESYMTTRKGKKKRKETTLRF